MTKKKLIVSSAVIFLIFLLIIISFAVKARNKESSNAKADPSRATPETLENFKSGKHTLGLWHEGKFRAYLVYLPKNYNTSSRYPLVFSLHGGGSDSEEQLEFNDLTTVSDNEGFVVVGPNAISGNWNDGRDHTVEKSGGADDVGFIKTIIEKLKAIISIDERKIYSTGISNGGMMSFRLACEASETFAAVAPVAATMPEELRAVCKPTKSVSVLTIAGTADPLVPYNGGEIKGIAGRDVDRGSLLSAKDTLNFWVTFNKCATPAKVSKLNNSDPQDGTTSTQNLYENCRSNNQVGLITVSGGGHTWPGGKQYLGERLVGKVSKDFSASEKIWEFFKTKTRN